MNIPNEKVHESWEDVYQKSVALAKMIKDSGEHFDVMVVVPRGGFYPANIVSRELGFGAVDIVQASIGSYNANQQGEFKIGQMPAAEQVRNKSLLIIDEVCDTGKTLNYLVEYLKDVGAQQCKTGVLHYKPGQSQVNFVPDWSVETTNAWIVYPWEEHDQSWQCKI